MPPASNEFPALHLFPLNSRSVLKKILLPTLAYPVRIGRLTEEEQERLAVDGKRIEPEEKNGYFEEETVSRHHANVWENPTDKKIYIQEIRSTFGTYLNGKRLDEEGVSSRPYELKTNDILELGHPGPDSGAKLRVVCILNQRDLVTANKVTSLDKSLEQLYQLVKICHDAFLECELVTDKVLIGTKKPAYVTFRNHMNELRSARRCAKRLLGGMSKVVKNRSEFYEQWPSVDKEIECLIEQERALHKLTSTGNVTLRVWERYSGKNAPEVSWLVGHIGELRIQMAVTDMTRRKNNRRGNAGREGRRYIKYLNAVRGWHVLSLEIIMGRLYDGSVAPGKVETLREAVADFVGNNMKPWYKGRHWVSIRIYDPVLKSVLKDDDLGEESNTSSVEDDRNESSINDEGGNELSSSDEFEFPPSSENSSFTSIESDTATLISGSQTTFNNGDTSTSNSHNTTNQKNHNSHNVNVTNHNYHYHRRQPVPRRRRWSITKFVHEHIHRYVPVMWHPYWSYYSYYQQMMEGWFHECWRWITRPWWYWHMS
ncbi:hypothetical protein V5O48_014627 [Marasmius crinis-equi]|uniref:FHA domain-containing protein n=1 Tax=Marasmius crinis-equi TaxID=585013 RepID=A0ABR3EWT2_9AGAR